VQDTRTGDTVTQDLGEWYEAIRGGVTIGRDSDCRIVLDAEEVAPREVEYFALGHHRFIRVLGGDVSNYVHPESRSRERRVDYSPIDIGPFVVTFDEVDVDSE
jgi:hypothetical protein